MAETRNTMQRQIVLQTVREMTGHPSADKIYLRIKKQHPAISRATVYRNLGILTTKGLVRHVELPGTSDSYDWNTKPHYHIICERCGAVEDVELPLQEEFPKSVAGIKGYEVHSHDILFKGICPACQRIG